VTPVDYDRRLYQTYRTGRSLSPDAGRLWIDALAAHFGRDRSDLTMLDLGAGTGRFSVLLADAFASQVVAVEPSEKMRAEAECGSPHACARVPRGRNAPHPPPPSRAPASASLLPPRRR
jgi:SAM-dependent methyltransferase